MEREINIFNTSLEEAKKKLKEATDILFREEEEEEIKDKIYFFLKEMLKDFLIIVQPSGKGENYLTILPNDPLKQGEEKDPKIATVTWEMVSFEVMSVSFLRIKKINFTCHEEGISCSKSRLKLLF